MSPNKIFMFLINHPSGNATIQKLIAKHIFECFEKRKGEDDKKQILQNLINNLLAFFVVCNFSYLKIVDIVFIVKDYK